MGLRQHISQGSDVPFEISEEYLSDKSYESLSSTDDDNDTDDDILNKIQFDKSNVTKEKYTKLNQNLKMNNLLLILVCMIIRSLIYLKAVY